MALGPNHLRQDLRLNEVPLRGSSGSHPVQEDESVLSPSISRDRASPPPKERASAGIPRALPGSALGRRSCAQAPAPNLPRAKPKGMTSLQAGDAAAATGRAGPGTVCIKGPRGNGTTAVLKRKKRWAGAGRDQQDRGCERAFAPDLALAAGESPVWSIFIILPRFVLNLSRATRYGPTLQTSWMNCFNTCTLRCRFTQLHSLKDAIKLQIGLRKATKTRDDNNRYQDLKQTKKQKNTG